MTEDKFRWAEAWTTYRTHGDQSELWLAERVGSLALAGDEAGVGRFRQIAVKLDEILRPSGSSEGFWLCLVLAGATIGPLLLP